LSNFLLTLCLACGVVAHAQELHFADTYRFDGKKFQWKVYVDEPSGILNRIRCVEYTLHPAFRDRVRLQCDGSSGFSLTETGPNEFTMIVAIEWKDGHKTAQSYALDLHSADGDDQKRITPVDLVDPLLKEINPVALQAASSSEVILADRNGVLLHIELQGRALAVKRMRGFGPDMVLTAVMGQIAGQPTTILSLVRADRAILDPFPPRGKGYGPWFGSNRGIFGWLCVDASGENLYAVEPANSPVIYSLDLAAGNSHVRQIMELPSSQGSVRGAGPTVWLGADHLFVCGEDGSTFYDVNLKSRKAKKFLVQRGSPVKSLKGPRAVVFDSIASRILVADTNLIRSVAINNEDSTVAIKEFGPRKVFKSLSAITRDASGNIWVGDGERHSIFVLSGEGILRKTLTGR